MQKEYKENDIIVCTHKGGIGGWIQEGEIAILGGIYYNINKINYGALAAKTIKNPYGNACSSKVNYRHATKYEIQAYNRGIRNIKDITQSNYYFY